MNHLPFDVRKAVQFLDRSTAPGFGTDRSWQVVRAYLVGLEVDVSDRLAGLMSEVIAEMKRAEHLFPLWPTDPLHANAIFQEEAGELGKAVLEACYQPHKATRETIREEGVQAAAMVFRFLLSLDRYAFTPGEQHAL